MDNELKHLLERYHRPTAQKLEVPDLFSLVEEMINSTSDLLFEVEDAPAEAAIPGQKQLTITLPIIRLSEKMWGKKGTRDREILQNLLGKIIGTGKTVGDKIKLLNDFLEASPEDSTLTSAEVLTYIVFLDTLTNIMLHFNASAAGFTFEGFLAALLKGEQVPAGTAEGIQDILDNEKNPLSLKLLTGLGAAEVHGSYKDLISHFTDPLRRIEMIKDPKTGKMVPNPKYVGKAGVGGEMKYIIGLKSWQEKDMAGNDNQGGWSEGNIDFYEFSFSTETFLTAISTGPRTNHDLLLLPANLRQEATPQEEHLGFTDEQFSQMWTGARKAYKKAQELFTPQAFAEFLDTHELQPLVWPQETTVKDPDTNEEEKVPHPEAGEPRIWKGGQHRGKPVLTLVEKGSEPGASIPTIRPLKHAGADPRYAKVAGLGATDEWLSFGESWKILQASSNDDEVFWSMIGQTKGAVRGTKPAQEEPQPAEETLTEASESEDGGEKRDKGESQFAIAARYYRQEYDPETGVGFLGRIKVGKAVVTRLANKYANILNQKIFDIYAQLEKLSDFLNAYFVAGDKDAALEAARAAGRIEGRTRSYEKQMKAQDIEPDLEAAE